MLDFLYHFNIIKTDQDVSIQITLSFEGIYTSVYNRSFELEVLSNKTVFKRVYHEFKEYLNYTKISIKKEDLELLYKKLNEFSIQLPNIVSITYSDGSIDLTPYSNQLTIKEMLYLTFIDGKEIRDKRLIPWENENHLNIAFLTEVMLHEGYITTSDYKQNLLKANRALLVSVVNSYQLNMRGDNKDLIERIQSTLTEEQIKHYFSATHYHLTNKGLAIRKKCQLLEDFNRSYYKHVENMRIEEFHILSIKKAGYNFQALSRLLLTEVNKTDVKTIDWHQEFAAPKTVGIPPRQIENKYQSQISIGPADHLFDMNQKIRVSFLEPMVEKSLKQITEEPLLNSNDGRFEQILQNKTQQAPVENPPIDVLFEGVENYKMQDSLKQYHKRKEEFEKQQSLSIKSEEKYKKRWGIKLASLLLTFSILLVLVLGLLIVLDVVTVSELKSLLMKHTLSIEEWIKNFGFKLKVFNE